MEGDKDARRVRTRTVSWLAQQLAVLSAALFAASVVRAGEGQYVPVDKSLRIGEYEALGVPDPRTSWTIDQYISALRSLGSIERAKLPRVGSDRSGLLFERLVITHLSVPEIVVSRTAVTGKAVPTFPALYSAEAEDRLLFDRELVAIRAAELKAMISDAPTQVDVAEGERVAAKLYEASEGQQRRQHAQQLLDYAQVLQQSSEALRVRFGRLLYLGSFPKLQDGARADLVTALSESVSVAEGRMTAADRRMLAVEITALGRLEWNSSIRDALMQSASVLKADTAKP